jgi:hypothetical protein
MLQIVEVLLYQLKPGTGDEFFTIMQDVSVPLHRKHGIDVVWHGQSMHDPDCYGLVRAFTDMATLEMTQAAFYSSEAWRSGPREDIIARIEVATRIVVPMVGTAIDEMRKQGSFQEVSVGKSIL